MDSSKTGYEQNFPAYFVSETEVYIKLDLDKETDQIYGRTSSGEPYTMEKVIDEARIITEGEYNKQLEKKSLPK